MNNEIIKYMNMIQETAYELSNDDDCQWYIFCDYAGHVNLLTVRARSKVDMDRENDKGYQVWLENEEPAERLFEVLLEIRKLIDMEG